MERLLLSGGESLKIPTSAYIKLTKKFEDRVPTTYMVRSIDKGTNHKKVLTNRIMQMSSIERFKDRKENSAKLRGFWRRKKARRQNGMGVRKPGEKPEMG